MLGGGGVFPEGNKMTRMFNDASTAGYYITCLSYAYESQEERAIKRNNVYYIQHSRLCNRERYSRETNVNERCSIL